MARLETWNLEAPKGGGIMVMVIIVIIIMVIWGIMEKKMETTGIIGII